MGHAIILLDERLLLHLLELPAGTRVLSSMNYPLGQCVAIGIESDALPEVAEGCDALILRNLLIERDKWGRPYVRWPDLEPPEPKAPPAEKDYTKGEAW